MTTKIEWTDATLNPGIYGCSPASAGCAHCYAQRMAQRLSAMGADGYSPPVDALTRGEGVDVVRDGRWTGVVLRVPIAEAEARIRRVPHPRVGRRRVFVTSMGDLLHEAVPVGWVASCIRAMALRGDIDWQVLTKRASRWPELSRVVVDQLGAWPRNVWTGVTAENQAAADERIPHLLEVPAAVRFLSVEPMLGPVDLCQILPQGHGWPYGYDALTGVRHPDMASKGAVSWVIVGGESGPHARPMHPAWARDLRDQCQDAGVPFFFKQWGEWAPAEAWVEGAGWRWPGEAGHPDATMQRVGRRAAGRLLDGRTWDEFPEVAP